MRISQCDVLIVPGLAGSDEDHWQSRWEERLSSATRVEQADWHNPDREAWVENLVQAVAAATRPAVIVAHSLGTLAAAHAAPRFAAGKVIGGFLVAVPDAEQAADLPPQVGAFAPVPTAPLPFPALLVASRNDPFCTFARAQEIALDWGAQIVDAGEVGHLNAASGHGPWPEGLMRLGHFLGRLG
ncbi:MAG: RBBP9/YdeN family alpha/beta hydrolase [Pseudochelatococcus sp.]|jgi:predicted alpha/beta hydrolase family esterase|uniref:RBBP9/YdeN family alpha/beta hydrolase n=1 Tax=Pseudochelatococcus sp. TaxID=2020869 RepID=UPI003D8E82D6